MVNQKPATAIAVKGLYGNGKTVMRAPGGRRTSTAGAP